MIKVLFLLGTRPEAIKLAPVIGEFRLRPNMETRVAITAQHREMLDPVLEFFGIKPDFDMNVMRKDQSLSQLTSDILLTLSENVFKTYIPDWVVVQGDTTTAMAGALSAFYFKIKVAHVEAGLRSHRMDSPFPEEMNRMMVSRLTALHFCPTAGAVKNLEQEGIVGAVYNVGNTVVDAAELGIKKLNESQEKFDSLFKAVDFKKKVILLTCHRRESFGAPFEEVCKAIVDLVERREDYQVVYPVHLNPNVQKSARALLQHPRIVLMEPLNYPHLLWLMSRCQLIITDSGGIQEEAPTFKKPVLVLREVTERQEGIDSGAAILVGTDRKKITDQATSILTDNRKYESMVRLPNPYGDGKTSKRIADILTAG